MARSVSAGPESPSERFQDEAVRRAAAEIQEDSKSLADNLKGDFPEGDVESPGRKKYLEYFRNNWDNPQWRTAEKDRVGDHNFLHAAYAAFGLKEPNWNQVNSIPQGISVGSAQPNLGLEASTVPTPGTENQAAFTAPAMEQQ